VQIAGAVVEREKGPQCVFSSAQSRRSAPASLSSLLRTTPKRTGRAAPALSFFRKGGNEFS
jgi:hypothetical protein